MKLVTNIGPDNFNLSNQTILKLCQHRNHIPDIYPDYNHIHAARKIDKPITNARF